MPASARFSPPASARSWSASARTKTGWWRWATPRRCTRRQPSPFRPGSPALPARSTPPTRASSLPRWPACCSRPKSWSGSPSPGADSLLAAFVGGLLVPSLSNYLSAISPSLWQLFMGGLFIAAITLFRGGVAGFLGGWRHDGAGGHERPARDQDLGKRFSGLVANADIDFPLERARSAASSAPMEPARPPSSA